MDTRCANERVVAVAKHVSGSSSPSQRKTYSVNRLLRLIGWVDEVAGRNVMRRTLMIAARIATLRGCLHNHMGAEPDGEVSMRCLGMRDRFDDTDFDEHSCSYSSIHVMSAGSQHSSWDLDFDPTNSGRFLALGRTFIDIEIPGIWVHFLSSLENQVSP